MKAAVYTLAAAIALSAAAFTWSNRYQYSSTQTEAGPMQTRTHRLTGRAEVLWVGLGWRPAETPLNTIGAELAAAR